MAPPRRFLLLVASLLVVGAVAIASTSTVALGAKAPAATTSSAKLNRLSSGNHTITLTFPKRKRTFILYVPPGAQNARRSLILVYHGADDTAQATIGETDFEQVANTNDQLVAFLQGYDDTWNDQAGHTAAQKAGVNDVVFTSATIAKIASYESFNHASVAAVGFSNGATFVEDLGCHLASEVSLIVPVEGELPAPIAKTCKVSRPLSVLEIHGTADASIPYNGGFFQGVAGYETVLSAPASVARWATLDHCAATPSTSYPSSTVTLSTYDGCKGGVSVVLHTINEGTHQWVSGIGELVSAALNP